jgi:hypothetical protein
MWLLAIPAAVALLLIGVFIFYPRKAAKKTQEFSGTVCKKCGAPIAVSNPSMIQNDSSVKRAACHTREFEELSLHGQNSQPPVDIRGGCHIPKDGRGECLPRNHRGKAQSIYSRYQGTRLRDWASAKMV